MLSASTRLLRLLSLLLTRRHWTGIDLAERLEIHPRTLRRDMDRLRQLGYPIRASSGVEGGYSFRPGQDLPPLLLEDDEAFAVTIALRTAAAGMVNGIEESALRALVKLEQVMPARLRRRVDALRSAIQPLGRAGPAIDANALATLAAACRDQLRIEFAYVDRNGAATTRPVEPQGVVHTGHRWYLVAWDLLRADWRTFRIDRIQDDILVGSHFAPRPSPEGGDLRAFVSRSLAVNAYAEQASVILHAPLNVMAQRIPPYAGVLEAVDENRCLLRSGASDLDFIVYWLLALDVDFDVVAPAKLSDRLRIAAARLARCVDRASE
jgi:predicted DNA-binding transcriptional regulator YafY